MLLALTGGCAARQERHNAAVLMNQQDYVGAVAELRKAAEQAPTDTHISALLGQAESKAADHHLALATAYQADRRLRDARREIEFALDMIPVHPEARRRLHEIEQAIAEGDDHDERVIERAHDLLRQAEGFAAADRHESAWWHGLQAHALCGNVREQANRVLREAEAALRQRYAFGVAVLPIVSGDADAAAVNRLCAALAEEVRRRRPAHVRIAQPEDAVTIAAELELSPADLDQPAARNAIARRLPGCDLLLVVELTAQLAEQRRAHEPGTSRYLAGRKNVRNPDYALAEQALEQTRRDLRQARSEALLNERQWNVLGRRDLRSDRQFRARALTGYYGEQARTAAAAYDAAQYKLQHTPLRVDAEDWREYRYPVHFVERELTLTARLRAIELRPDQSLHPAASSLSTQHSSLSTHHPSLSTQCSSLSSARAVHGDTQIDAVPAYQVPAKAAQLKEPAELLAEAMLSITEALHGEMGPLLAARSTAQLLYARQTTGDEAVAGEVRFLFEAGPDAVPAAGASALDTLLDRIPRDQQAACRQLILSRLGLSLASATQPATRPGDPNLKP